MKYTFESSLKAFNNDNINLLGCSPEGVRFLKLRSLSRSELMTRLADNYGVAFTGLKGMNLLKTLYDSKISDLQIDEFIKSSYKKERIIRRQSEDSLINELYKVSSFEWGGLHQNSLEKTIVDNYVKRIRSFDELNSCIENELHNSLRAYVTSSWYNHWTSIIIEDVFRDHQKVLPAIGLIKKVDFFVKNIPFDLKVTYLPEGYIKLEDLWTKVKDHPSEEARELIHQLRDKRLKILDLAKNKPSRLIKWLYENQGVRRFDSANRLFLVLVNCENFFESWKLKRAKPLLIEKIHGHFDLLDDLPGFEITFRWENVNYRTRSDIIFIDHNR
ncbi:hypothetical protein JW926_00520 [Candidatus Sumerlaeota bacterium]|nr:hypothetical protein [Candidatus Sumerlaeota bacterium]